MKWTSLSVNIWMYNEMSQGTDMMLCADMSYSRCSWTLLRPATAGELIQHRRQQFLYQFVQLFANVARQTKYGEPLLFASTFVWCAI